MKTKIFTLLTALLLSIGAHAVSDKIVFSSALNESMNTHYLNFTITATQGTFIVMWGDGNWYQYNGGGSVSCTYAYTSAGQRQIQVISDEACTITGFRCIDVMRPTALDVSGASQLTSLTCNGGLSYLDLSNNTELTYLDVYRNNLVGLDLSHNGKITYLDCSYNPLAGLSIAGLTGLETFDCSNTKMTALPAISGSVKDLTCKNNAITSIALSGAMVYVDCSNCQLTSLSINAPNLKSLDCYNNKLTSLNVTACEELCSVNCYNNQLTGFDCSNLTNVQVDCRNNLVDHISLGSGNNLLWISCDGNRLPLSALYAITQQVEQSRCNFGTQTLATQTINTTANLAGEMVLGGKQTAFSMLRDGNVSVSGVDYQPDYTNQKLTFFVPAKYEVTMTNASTYSAAVNVTYVVDNAACGIPSNITASNVTDSGATLSWDASVSSPSGGYQYEVRASGPVGSGTTGLIASGNTPAGVTSATVSGLSCNTAYTAYVRSNCGSGSYSRWSDGYSFSSALPVVSTYPYVHTFSSNLNCWMASEGTAGSSTHWATSLSRANFGPIASRSNGYFAYLYVYVADPKYNPYYLTTSSFVLGSTPKRVSYFYYLGNSGYTTTPVPLTLQISADGGTTWTDLYQHTTANSTFATNNAVGNWKRNTVDLSAYANQTIQLRFASNSNWGSGYSEQAIDEVTVEDIPACFEPSSLAVSNITATSVDVSWTAPAPAPANGYQYELRLAGTPGSGAAGLMKSGNITAGATSLSISGLLMGTNYFVYLRSNCGGSDYSRWTEAIQFTTLTAPVTVFPYTQDFYATFTDGWKVSEAYSGSLNHWETVTSDATYGVSAAKSGNYFARLNVYYTSSNNNPYYLTSPSFTLDNAPKQVGYYYYLGNGGYKTSPVPLTLQISVDNGTTWTNLYQHTSTNSVFATSNSVSNWTFNAVDLTAYANKTIQLRFAANSNNGDGFCNQAIDLFSIDERTACFEPVGVKVSQITATTALLSWTASTSSPANGYQYEVRTSGNAGSGASGLAASGNTTGVSVAVSGLTQATAYSIYVRSDCGGNYSRWTEAVSFKTTVGSYPYLQSFSSALDKDWTASEAIAGASYHWQTASSDGTYGVNGPQAGSYFARLSVVNAGTAYNPYYLNAPAFTLDNAPKQVTYYYYLGNNGYKTSPVPLSLQISVDFGATWTNLYQHTSDNSNFAATNAISNWKKNTVDLSAYANQTVMLRFASNSNKGSGFCNQAIDEFVIENIPSCVEVSPATVSNVTASTALISWSASPSNPANGYQYEVRTSGTPGSGATGLAASGTAPAGATSVTASGLPMGIACSAYVRSDCGGGDYSRWSDATVFTSGCSAITAFPYVQSFGSVLNGCWSASEKTAGATVHWETVTADSPQGLYYPAAGSYFARLNVNSASVTYNPYYLNTPSFTLDNTPKWVTYYYYLGNNGNKNSPVPLTLQITVDGGSTWTDLYQHTDENSFFYTTSDASNWRINRVDLSAYANRTIALRFAANSKNTYTANQGIDEFTIENIPSCIEPFSGAVSNITASSALVSWSASWSNPTGGYQYEVRASGAAGSGATGLATSGNTSAGVLNATVSGLSGSTGYTVYVRSNCGGGNYSPWATIGKFNTLCSTVSSYPYVESFGAVLNPCWSVSEGTPSTSIHWQTIAADASHGAGAPQAGDYFVYLNVYLASQANNPYYLTSPTFTLGNAQKQVSYWYYLGYSGYTTTPVPLTLQISADNGTTWTDLYPHTPANSTFASGSAVSYWKLNTVDLSAYINKTVVFRFAANSNYGNGYCNIGIDEFTVEDKDFTDIATLPHDGKALSLYPNPVHDVLHLDGLTEPVATRVVDFSGRTVLIKQNVVESIDVSSLPAGIYLLQINTNDGVTIKKFIKQ